ncbi:MAG TPA: hypothetical protein VEX60_18155 [Pyrinomonadaceae bacterium]|nr:hypothetical protein [Pyrinomonadaceae bacterium]
MKYLFIFALLSLVATLIYWRLRPYIKGVRRFLGVVREMRSMNAGARTDAPSQQQRKSAPNEKLSRCAACGTWMPASRAVTLRATGATFCSHSCLERSADSTQKARKSAS